MCCNKVKAFKSGHKKLNCKVNWQSVAKMPFNCLNISSKKRDQGSVGRGRRKSLTWFRYKAYRWVKTGLLSLSIILEKQSQISSFQNQDKFQIKCPLLEGPSWNILTQNIKTCKNISSKSFLDNPLPNNIYRSEMVLHSSNRLDST